MFIATLWSSNYPHFIDQGCTLKPEKGSRQIVCVLLSCIWLFVTPWGLTCQAPLLMEFSRQEYWSGVTFPSSGHLPDPGIEPESLGSPVLAGELFTTSAIWEAPVKTYPNPDLPGPRAHACAPPGHLCTCLCKSDLTSFPGTVGPIDSFDGSLHTMLRPSLIIGQLRITPWWTLAYSSETHFSFFSIMFGDNFVVPPALLTAHRDSGSPRKVLGVIARGLGVWHFWLKFREVRKSQTQ